MASALRRLRIDPFLIILLVTVALASTLPVRAAAANALDAFTDCAIALLFFLHGAKLSRQAIISGIGAWRIHVLVFTATFVLFPLMGLAVRAIGGHELDPAVTAGILLMTFMPSTVQSSIAFTAMARGNVPAAVCSASLSNLLGVIITPFLVSIFLGGEGGALSSGAIVKIVSQLLLPFIAGHLSRPLIQGFLDRHKGLLAKVDRSVIVLVVYTAFSAAVVEGLWSRYALGDLAWTLGIDALILTLVILATTWCARMLRFSTEDEITIVFCGSKKSLASGVPIAGALFPAALVGPMILPLMIFHQIQLMTCAVLAQRYARRISHRAAVAHVAAEAR